MEYFVTLMFTEDPVNGDKGLIPYGCTDDNEGNSFNAVTDGYMVFHDVFEHWFEENHPLFRGECARNISGEVVAGGCFLYFMYMVKLSPTLRLPFAGSLVPAWERAIKNTQGMLIDNLAYGGSSFGGEFITGCKVNWPHAPYILDETVNEHWYRISQVRPKGESGFRYRKSLSHSKLASCYYFGWQLAESVCPNTEENRETLETFIEFWDKFFKVFDIREEYQQLFYKLRFHVWVEDEQLLWSCDIHLSDANIIPCERSNPYKAIDEILLFITSEEYAYVY